MVPTIRRIILVVACFLPACQAPASMAHSEPAPAARDGPTSELRDLFIKYRCYRLTGRFDEAREAKKSIEAFVLKSSEALSPEQRLFVIVVLHGSHGIIGAGDVIAARRHKRECAEKYGIYEITLHRPTPHIAPSGAMSRMSSTPSPLPSASHATARLCDNILCPTGHFLLSLIMQAGGGSVHGWSCRSLSARQSRTARPCLS